VRCLGGIRESILTLHFLHLPRAFESSNDPESALKPILVVIDVSTAELLPPPASDDGRERENRAHVDRTEIDAQIVL
jgi:hypothetical protein